MLVVAAVLLSMTAAVLTMKALAVPRVRMQLALRQVDAYGFVDRSAGDEVEERRGLADLAAKVGLYVAGRTTVDVERLHRALRGSGAHDVRVETVLGYRVLGAVLAPVALIFSLASSGVSPALVLMVGGIGGLLGWRMPIVTLEKKAELRHKQIDRELPELIDLLVVTVEAGMGFTQALALASERLSDPLGEELRRALREQQMGRSVEEALEALLERCDTPAMRAFVRSTMRGESLGVSIGAILRNLAVDMRRIRRQDAEEQAQKAPIKMLFPLVFLIFPGVMIVLLGPAGFSISSAFGS